MKVALNTLPPEFKEFGVFYREKRLYEDMIPSFEKLLRDAGIEISFGPKYDQIIPKILFKILKLFPK